MVLRIFKMIATSGFLADSTKFVFGRGATLGELTALTQTIAGLKSPTSKGRGTEGERKRQGRAEGNGRGRPPFANF